MTAIDTVHEAKLSSSTFLTLQKERKKKKEEEEQDEEKEGQEEQEEKENSSFAKVKTSKKVQRKFQLNRACRKHIYHVISL